MDTLKEISHFYEQVVQYETLVKEWQNTPSKDIENAIQTSRTELQRSYPNLEKSISRYGEYRPRAFAGQKFDYFDIAFDSIDKSNVNGKLNALNETKKILNKAIGNLETEGDSWPDKKERLRQPQIKKSNRKRSTYQKFWKWIDTHRILSILGALAALATIFGVIYSILG